MNVKSAKKPQKRVDVNFQQRFKMQSYGADNLYPQNIMAITGASGTAQLCLNRYEKFIEGYGFNNEYFSEMAVNREGVTMDDLLHQVAGDVAHFGGFALHVNYNVLGQISEVNFMPFEQCRLEETDDAGNVAHILVHCDWRGDKTRNGQKQTVSEKFIGRFDVFNPDTDVVTRQIDACGGIENYKGQILWLSLDGKNQYPVPLYDAVITEISTDEGLGNIKYRNVRNNFLVACMLIAKKGSPRINDNGEEEERQMIADEDLKEFQGDTKGSKILYVELENDEDEPKVVPFPIRNFDKEFATTDESVIERIYSQFHQELFYSIRIGKLGFSGQVMQDAYEYYAGEVTTEQRFIERAFTRVFGSWHDVTIPRDFSIRPMKYISAENNDKLNGE
jgi:hypothetical protein|nr:MAG TPA: HK97 Family Phage Portal Protein [Caudoviricetes sp.]